MAMLVDYGNWPYRRRVAHRGAGKLAPENTLAAMRRGAFCGYRMFEFDVKLSGDGTLVLMHDATVERTTDGSGRLGALTMAEIAKLDAGSWHGAEYAGEGVPTFGRVAAWLIANGHLANVEIKPSPGADAETGAAAALEARNLWQRCDVPPLLSSFSESALRAARETAPELPRALLMRELPADWLDRCRALECVALDADHRALAQGVIAAAHEAGLRVAAYTVNDPERARQLDSWGLDCLITDAVDSITPE